MASCEVTYTNQEVKSMMAGDTVFCNRYNEPFRAVVTKNDTTHMIICYRWSQRVSTLDYGYDVCETYNDFRMYSKL